MRGALILLILLPLIPLAQSLDIFLSCPETVGVDEEFDCTLELSEGSGTYDMKFEIKEGTKTITDVFVDNSWKSGYYYLKEFIEGDEKKEFSARIEKSGEFQGKIKLRLNGKTEEFDFEIEVEEEKEVELEKEEIQSIKEENTKTIIDEEIISEIQEEIQVITLNSVKEIEPEVVTKRDTKYSITEYIYITITLILLVILFFSIRDKF